MLLPEKKEREYRFKLALRMGLPIFALIFTFTFHTFSSDYSTLRFSFYLEVITLLVVSIYFIFYLIYNGFDTKITDEVTNTFTREYLYKYLNKEIKNRKKYSLLLLSIDNLNDINSLYGIKNGDKVLKKFVLWIEEYFKNEGIVNFPLGHIKGTDFIVGLDGEKEKYLTLIDLFCLKSNEFSVDDIEVKISGAIIDTNYSSELDYLIEHLFEIQNKRKNSKNEDEINPNELELLVINAMRERNLLLMKQDVYEGKRVAFKECFVKLKGENSKIIHPKTYRKVINKLSLSVEFDLMVLEEILLKYHADEFTYAINIVPSSLRNEKFLTRVRELSREYTEFNMIFVLAESEYYTHIKKYNHILFSLKKMGIKIVIDRVASIHTSFLYLRDLEVDVIRFDSYYSNENKLEENINIISGFNSMAKKKGIKTWLKNIQTERTLELANRLEIDYVQGKYLSDLELG